MSVPPQGGVDAGRAITTPALGMDQTNVLGQFALGDRPRALGPTALDIIAAGRQAQGRAHHGNRAHLTMLIDEPELHREAAPKMSAAFGAWRRA